MRRRLLAASIPVALAFTASAAVGDPAAEGGAASYARYCASCHGPQGEGAAGAARPEANAPPLRHLAEKYGLPLPRVRLSKFIQLETRPGGGRLCGDRLLPNVPAMYARRMMERAVVAEALAHLETLQRGSRD